MDASTLYVKMQTARKTGIKKQTWKEFQNFKSRMESLQKNLPRIEQKSLIFKKIILNMTENITKNKNYLYVSGLKIDLNTSQIKELILKARTKWTNKGKYVIFINSNASLKKTHTHIWNNS